MCGRDFTLQYNKGWRRAWDCSSGDLSKGKKVQSEEVIHYMRGSKAITEKEAWEKLQWVGTRNGDFSKIFL